MGVRNAIAETWAFAADITVGRHGELLESMPPFGGRVSGDICHE